MAENERPLKPKQRYLSRLSDGHRVRYTNGVSPNYVTAGLTADRRASRWKGPRPVRHLAINVN
ncbi:MAG: hypothetical protein H6631_20765 [Anaerolineaceae bacterium]|nr:hypothetical protein [Anaerolineaceae bacterium]